MADSGYPISIISIHALREESDTSPMASYKTISYFNPRSP